MIPLRVVLPTIDRSDIPGILEIASGSEWATTVRDVRSLGPWTTPSAVRTNRSGKLIVYHHTASDIPTGSGWGSVRAWLEAGRRTWPYGVPYNFLVMPKHGFRIYYLNDVDGAWPHTYGYNWATAIAACGNYSDYPPPVGMVERMLRLADALATMWGQRVTEIQHRDVYATECPGDLLAPLLPHHGAQRD